MWAAVFKQSFMDLILLRFEFGHYLSVCVGQLQSPSTFMDTFTGQLITLQNVEEEDRTVEAILAQVSSVPSPIFKAAH